MENSDLEIFFRQVRARTKEHQKALSLLIKEKLYGVAISIIGQELDTLLRLAYLLTISNMKERNRLITDSVEGKRWKRINKKGKIVTIRESDMFAELETTTMWTWAKEAYKVRNSFIHLSHYHDYKNRDPLSLMNLEDRNELIYHLRNYHQFPRNIEPTFNDIVPYFENVFQKFSDHVNSNLNKLEKQDLS